MGRSGDENHHHLSRYKLELVCLLTTQTPQGKEQLLLSPGGSPTELAQPIGEIALVLPSFWQPRVGVHP